MQIFVVLLALFVVLLGVLQKQAVATCVRIYMRRWVLMSTPAGVVQGRLLFVVVVQAGCDVVLLFLFEHFNTVQCPTLSYSKPRQQDLYKCADPRPVSAMVFCNRNDEFCTSESSTAFTTGTKLRLAQGK